ncbi:MAG: histidine phosphatase family protein [Burkholderiaceae bacterium]
MPTPCPPLFSPRAIKAPFAATLAIVFFFAPSTGAQTPAAPASTLANAADSAPAPGAALSGAALVKALRAGGLVVYFRHTATDFSQTDSASTGYSDCANQRLLSAQGRQDAEAIGKEIRRLALPVAEVLASPMCRTMDHAERSFGKAAVSPRAALREAQAGPAATGSTGGAGGLNFGGSDYAELKTWMATAPAASGGSNVPGNRFIVGHGIPFRSVAGAPHLAEGEAAVLQPEGRRWRVLARLQVADWAQLPR